MASRLSFGRRPNRAPAEPHSRFAWATGGFLAFAVCATVTTLLSAGVASIGAVSAQAADVRIDLDCGGSPQTVVIANGDAVAHDVTGWRLESDPPDKERFDLSVVRVLQSEASVTIESGPAATGPFVWSKDLILRPGDATDYVRLVDSQGDTIQEVTCAFSGSSPSPSPSPSPTPPSTTPSSGDVPNGGGPPAPSATVLSPMLAIALGGTMSVAGFIALVSTLGGIVMPKTQPASGSAQAPRRSPSPKGDGLRPAASGAPASIIIFVLLVGLVAVLAWRWGERGERRA